MQWAGTNSSSATTSLLHALGLSNMLSWCKLGCRGCDCDAVCVVLALLLVCSVTKQEICDAIYQQTGRNLADMDMEMPEIKALGTFECSVKLVSSFGGAAQHGTAWQPLLRRRLTACVLCMSCCTTCCSTRR